MAAALYLGALVSPRYIRMDLLHILGTLVIPRGSQPAVYLVGALTHAAMSLIIGLIYVVFFLFFAEDSNVIGWGVFFGFVHWIIMGANLEVMGYIHPLMRTRELRSPGMFGINYPRPTVGVFLFLHLIFGLIIGGLYTAFTP